MNRFHVVGDRQEMIMETLMQGTGTTLLSRFDVSSSHLERLLGTALVAGADGEIYFESTTTETLSLEDSEVKRSSFSTQQGAGIRVVVGEKTGYAYSDDVSPDRLLEAAKAARSIARSGKELQPVNVNWASKNQHHHSLYPVDAPLPAAPLAGKIELLTEIDRIARAVDPRIVNVMATLSLEHRSVLIARPDGLLVTDERPLLHLRVVCIAENKAGRQSASAGGGGRISFESYVGNRQWCRAAREAARQALVNLDAKDAPAGTMDVVLGPGWPGILLHEAIGHGLEGDFNRKGTSAFAGRLGQRVASELCTIVDDGTIAFRRGSLNVDDEGTPTQRTVLIENGILQSYLHDRQNARLMGHLPTGNGRRQSFAHSPMPRMTNTFMLAGSDDPEEIVKKTRSGLYAKSFGGGQVDITSGRFVFTASEAYLIEDGRIGAPVRGATLIGNGPEVLMRVSAVGCDLQLDEGMGTCGKSGQSVPVGVGLPTIRVEQLTVGGTALS